jgi:GDPmannose 4,6-dehydratase
VGGNSAAWMKMGVLIVKMDSRYFCPLGIDVFLANMAEAKTKLGWVTKITVEQICSEIVANDLDFSKHHGLLNDYERKLSP